MQQLTELTSWPVVATPEVVQTAAHLHQPVATTAAVHQAALPVHQATLPVHQLELKSEPIIALPAGAHAYAIPITVHPTNQHLVLSPEPETVEFRPQRMVEFEQTVEPINEPFAEQPLVRNGYHHYDRKGRLQRFDYK